MKTTNLFLKVVVGVLLAFTAIGCSKDKGGNNNPYGYYGQCVQGPYGYVNPQTQQPCQPGMGGQCYLNQQTGQYTNQFGQPCQPGMGGGGFGPCMGPHQLLTDGQIYNCGYTADCRGHQMIPVNQFGQPMGQVRICQ